MLTTCAALRLQVATDFGHILAARIIGFDQPLRHRGCSMESLGHLSSLFILLLATASLSFADEVQTTTGQTLQGELLIVDSKGVVVRASAGNIRTAIREILQVRMQREGAIAPDAKYCDLELTDGSLIHCSSFSLKGKQIEAQLAVSELSVRVPLAAVSYVLNDAQDPAVRQEWQEKHLPRRGNQDVLSVKLNGVVNDLNGTFGDKESDKGMIVFEYGSGESRRKREIDLTNAQVIQGVGFLRGENRDSPPELCRLYDVNQNIISASRIELGTKSVKVTSVAGLVVSYPRDGIARLDFNNGKIVYLSDVRPAELVIRSLQGRADRLGIDRSLENGPIQIDGQVFPKGLAIHAHTELLYNLDGKYSKFEATLGMDDAVGGFGRPSVRIEVDGKELLRRTITHQNKRMDVNFGLKGVKQLRIVVTSSGGPGALDFGDHIDLANAKLSR